MIVLASISPRRRDLLDRLGIPYEIDPAHVDERLEPGELPETFAVRLAREKARAVSARRPGRWVLAADTVVVLGDELLGKPESPAAAKRMLARLSGNEHRVVTAVALARDGELLERCDVTRVWFRRLSDELIDAYVATGEPLDKAGSYGLQERGAVLVERIEGDYFGVIGLPVRLVVDLLEDAGIPYSFTR
ncbi:MAG: Maf family protein [Gemmatimonadales bacterium]